MRGVRYIGDGEAELVELSEPPDPGPGEVLIAVERSGICGSDLRILSKPADHPAVAGVILGHEFAGTVIATGEGVAGVEARDRVAVAPDQGCGVCDECHRGHPMSCRRQVNLGVTSDGGMVELVALPERFIHRLSNEVDWGSASLLEPLACVLGALRGIDPLNLHSAAVIGAGPIGLLAVSVLARWGVGVVMAYERHETRRALATGCGATQVADGSDLGLEHWTAAAGDARGPDLIVEATGYTLADCVGLAAPRATIVQFGYSRAAEATLRPAELVEKGLTITGSNGSEFMFPAAVDFVTAQPLPYEQIVTAEMPIFDFGVAVDRMRVGAEAKVVISFSD